MQGRALNHETTTSGVYLSEIVGSIAIASDLGLGQPLEHVLRSCVIATRVADRLGASREDRDATYWSTLFVAAGCTGVSFELQAMFGDDIAFRAGAYDTFTNLSFPVSRYGAPAVTAASCSERRCALILREMYAAVSPDGPDHFDVVWDKLSPAWTAFPLINMSELVNMGAPTLVLVGDRDMVTVEHAATISRAIPEARLGVIPGEHSVPIDKPGLAASHVLDFLEELGSGG